VAQPPSRGRLRRQGRDTGEHTDEWLYDFIGRNLDTDLPQLAQELKSKLEFDLRGQIDAEPMLLHLGGFVEDAGQWKPHVWYIRNATAPTGYQDIKDEFDVSEEIQTYFRGQTGDEIQAQVDQLAHNWRPFWFHQGYDLNTFNTLEHVLRLGMRVIVENPAQPQH
jgi:hypothetical protein